MFSLAVVNMGEELFNDGLFYSEQAFLNKDQPFIKWRYCRSAIISYCASAEAEMAKLIAFSLNRQQGLTNDQERILRFISDPNAQFAPPVELLKIQSKYDLLRNLNGLPTVSIDKHYDDLTKLRNKIIHYTFSGKDKVYSDTILDSVRNARDVVRTFILDLYSIVQEQPPTWVNFTSSRDIQ
jgi:hypothetical protein